MAHELDLHQLGEWLGKGLLSADGHPIGDVREIIYDYIAQDPVWIGVGSSQHPKFRILLVPARGATILNDQLTCAFTLKRVEDQPHVEFGEGFDDEPEKHRLYEYFGILPEPRQALRVLREGQDFPGLERVTSALD